MLPYELTRSRSPRPEYPTAHSVEEGRMAAGLVWVVFRVLVARVGAVPGRQST